MLSMPEHEDNVYDDLQSIRPSNGGCICNDCRQQVAPRRDHNRQVRLSTDAPNTLPMDDTVLHNQVGAADYTREYQWLNQIGNDSSHAYSSFDGLSETNRRRSLEAGRPDGGIEDSHVSELASGVAAYPTPVASHDFDEEEMYAATPPRVQPITWEAVAAENRASESLGSQCISPGSPRLRLRLQTPDSIALSDNAQERQARLAWLPKINATTFQGKSGTQHKTWFQIPEYALDVVLTSKRRIRKQWDCKRILVMARRRNCFVYGRKRDRVIGATRDICRLIHEAR